jgi:hypothetical protein
MENAVSIGLRDHGGNGEVGSVGLDRGWPVGLEVCEDGSCGEGVFQLAECLAGWIVEDKRAALLEQAGERSGDVGEAPDEAAVEIRKAEEDLEVSDGGRLWPIDDGGDLLGIHLDTRGGNQVPEILNLLLMK